MAHVNIDCVDGTGTDEFVQELRQMYPGALRVDSVGHMVHSVLGRLGSGRQIGRLRIFGHGSPGAQGLGQSHTVSQPWRMIGIDARCALLFRDTLALLTGRFAHWTVAAAPGRPEHSRAGWVELHGCDVAAGGGVLLVTDLASLWGVNVAAGTGTQDWTPGFEGYYVVGHPDGSYDTKMGTEVTGLLLSP